MIGHYAFAGLECFDSRVRLGVLLSCNMLVTGRKERSRGYVPRKAEMLVWKPPPPNAIQIKATTKPGIPHPLAASNGTEDTVNTIQPIA
jgi:hypothetical protein